MLVAISGSQGCGKSTLLNELASRGYNVIERKTSRSILSDWGVTLDQVNSDLSLSQRFQNEVIQRKIEDEQHAVESDELWFTERTYMDLFVYTLINFGKHNEYSEWLNEYFDACKAMQQTYSSVFYLPAGVFAVEHDGVRGSNKHYSRLIDMAMERYTFLFNNATEVEEVSVADRAEKVIQTCSHFYNF